MKIKSKIRQFIFLLPLAAGISMTQSCTEEIDTSARYTFTGNTIISYLDSHPDVYSEYRLLLDSVNISDYSSSKVSQLLSARGNYTCFAPTNEAIQNHLQYLCDTKVISVASWDAPEFDDYTLLKEIRGKIVYNSIVDGGDNQEAYQTSYFSERAPQKQTLALANMNDRKLVVSVGEGAAYAIDGCNISDKNCNIYTINGYIHQVDKVISPTDESSSDVFTRILKDKEPGWYTYSVLLEACGLFERLNMVEDEEYYRMKMTGELPEHFEVAHPTYKGNGGEKDEHGYNYGVLPERRYYGYTLFLEGDAVWASKLKPTFDKLGIAYEVCNPDSFMIQFEPEEILACINDFVTANAYHLGNAKKDDNYTDPQNALNQFVTYHILPARVESNKLVIHFNEYGFNQETKAPSSCVYDFYTTMGKPRLLKTYEAPVTVDGKRAQIYLNRFPVLDNESNGKYTEIACEEDKKGIELYNNGPESNNSYIYGLSDVLYYNDAVADVFAKERIRIDAATMFNELMTNDIRSNENWEMPYQCVGIPASSKYQYLEDCVIGDNCYFHYLTGRVGKTGMWANYQGDEFNVTGNYEILMKLPPVPKNGIYELRLGLSTNDRRGMCQVYWGSNKNALPAAGIPLDLRMSGTYTATMSGDRLPSIVGWEPDVQGDDDVNAEIDKKMRNNGYMKGPKSVHFGSQLLRDREQALRKVVVREHMEADKTYYIQFKNVMSNDDCEFFMDYIEYCAKEVYDNPVKPEDIW